MQKLRAYFGGYGDQYWTNLMQPNFYGTGNQITLCEVDAETGAMVPTWQTGFVMSPGTLVLSPDGKYLYCANETNSFGGAGFGGGLTAFAVDPATGHLTKINESLAFGSCTAYVTLDPTGQYLLAASHGSYYYVSRYLQNADGSLYPAPQYDEGVVTLFRIRGDGGIGELLDRVILEGTGADPLMHGSSHPHSVLVSEQDDVIIPNKGGDNIYVGKLDRAAGKLRVSSVFQAGKGSSPRHAWFCKGTPYVLVLNEFDGCLCSYRLDNGVLTPITRLDVCPPEGELAADIVSFAHPWGCDVQMHPNGKFVYADGSNNAKVALLWFDQDSGKLELKDFFPVAASGMTRGMQLTPDGRFLCVTCVNDDKAVMYAIDPESGSLTPAGEVSVPTPTALRFAAVEEE